jgi:hypothetical protein
MGKPENGTKLLSNRKLSRRGTSRMIIHAHPLKESCPMQHRTGRIAPMPVEVAPCSGEGVLHPVFILGVIIEAGVIVLTTPSPAS